MLIEVRLVKESVVHHLLAVRGVGIEFPPHRNHQMSVLIVDLTDPSIRVGKTSWVERMRAPGVRAPILPILNDGVEGNLPLPEFINHIETLLRRLVALARLPQTKGPIRQHRGSASQRTEAGD